MTDSELRQQLEAAVRGIATASKTLKLYPAASPIPRQAVETAAIAVDAYLELNPVLSLAIARAGFSWHGEPLGAGVPGVSDLADALREHDVAEIDILPGADADELMRFLTEVGRPVEDVRSAGGLGAALAAAGIEFVRATDVRLTVVEEVVAGPDEDVDEFLRQLASDPEKLAAWMAAAAAGDPSAYAEGLEGLAFSAGSAGIERLIETMARAFMMQEADGKDALLGLSLDPGTVRDLASGMFEHLGTGDIASSVCQGLFGENMLSLSNALTHLPLQERIDQVYEEVQRMLAQGEHTDKETQFLEHMMDVRTRGGAEPALVDAEPTYRQVAEVATLAPEEIERMRSDTEASRESMHTAGVTTMLTLLDQQEDFGLYVRSVDSLAAMVPRLIEGGELPLAERVLKELSARQARTVQPWPELTDRLREAIARAAGERSMAALMKAVLEDSSALGEAREIVGIAGEAAGPALIAEAIAAKDPGIAAAEQLLGRRVLDLLAAAAPGAQWFQVGPVVGRLAREGDPRSLQVIEAIVKRPDDQSRREAATALAGVEGEAAARLLGLLLRDASPEVETVAIRALGTRGAAGSAQLLGQRLGELDVDGKHFALAREIIGALAHCPDPEATNVLERIAGRKALIKRGHFNDVQELVRKAIGLRRGTGGA